MKSMNKIYSFGAALLLSMGFGACCLKLPALNSAISAKGNINLLTYAMVVVLFCVSFLIFHLISDRIFKGTNASGSNAAVILTALFILAHIVFMLAMFLLEVNVYATFSYNYIWHVLPLRLILPALTLELICFFFCLRGSRIRVSDHIMYPFYALLTLLVGYNFYTPAVFLRDTADRLHIDAYFNSVYNVLHGNPYTELTTSIYGHYAIFYKLPLKLLGGDFIDFILLNAFVGALCFLAMFLALHFTVKNNLLRLLGSIALTLPVLSMRSGVYWQLWPHRILFMSLMLCFAAACIRFRKLNRITCVLGYVLAAAGILWNTESGLFCAVAWAGFWILRYLCTHKFNLIKMPGTGAGHFLGVILSFAGAYGITNLYNLSCGGTVNSVKEFLFPLLQSSYMTDLLRVDLPEFPSAYMIIMVLLFMATAWGISHMSFFTDEISVNVATILLPCYAFFTAVLTLGQMTYFVNRAAYHNLEICHLPSILLLCIFAERGLHIVKTFHWKERRNFSPDQMLRGAIAAVALGVLVTVATGNLIQYGQTSNNRQQLHNKQDVHAFAAHIAANIPENTYGFGIGVPELYAMLRWDTQCYTLDFADLSLRPQVGDHVMDEIREKEIPAFLAGEQAIERFVKYCSEEKSSWLLENYEIAQEFEFQGAVLRYYVKK